jgi:hypothetical protein
MERKLLMCLVFTLALTLPGYAGFVNGGFERAIGQVGRRVVATGLVVRSARQTTYLEGRNMT